MSKSAESVTVLQAGYTNLYRYIGFQPPLSAEQRTLLTEAELVRSEQLEESGHKDPSTVAFFFTESCGSPAAADEFVQERMSQMAKILMEEGHAVEVSPDMVDMRGGCSSPFNPKTEIRWAAHE